jgi:hypothetical protein
MIRSGLGPSALPVLEVIMLPEGELALVLRVEWSGQQIYGDGWLGRFSKQVEHQRVVRGLKVLRVLELHSVLLQASVVHRHTVRLQVS